MKRGRRELGNHFSSQRKIGHTGLKMLSSAMMQSEAIHHKGKQRRSIQERFPAAEKKQHFTEKRSVSQIKEHLYQVL